MTDPISFPKLPVNLAEVVTDSPKRLQRTLNQKKGTSGAAASDPKLAETCRQMESLFINHLFKEMRASIQRSGLISGGRAEEIYTSMMDAEMAAKLSNRGGIGLADILMQQLKQPTAEDSADDSDLP
jgi:flagellar protein FlgJ